MLLVGWIYIICTYVKTELLLTNKRVIIKNPYLNAPLGYINLEEIRIVDSNDLPNEFTPVMYDLIIGSKSPYMISVSIRNNKGKELTVQHIGRSDYEKFKKLLTEECKKHGNKIS